MRKYEKGPPIKSLDQLSKQEFIFCRDQVLHNGLFKSWPLRMAEDAIAGSALFAATKKEAS